MSATSAKSATRRALRGHMSQDALSALYYVEPFGFVVGHDVVRDVVVVTIVEPPSVVCDRVVFDTSLFRTHEGELTGWIETVATTTAAARRNHAAVLRRVSRYERHGRLEELCFVG